MDPPSPVIVHAAKDPCHVKAAGTRTLPRHIPTPSRSTWASATTISCSISSTRPYRCFQVTSFQIALDFLDLWYPSRREIVIRCNQGLSRAPSIALLWLAKRAKAISSSESYAAAAKAFLEIYPAYNPGGGIRTFLAAHWDEI